MPAKDLKKRAQRPKIRPNWLIRDLDHGFTINPQYPLDTQTGLSVSIGSNLAQQQRFGFQDPVIHWINGKTKTFTFETIVAADYAGSVSAVDSRSQKDSTLTDLQNSASSEQTRVRRLLDQFEIIATKDETLGRSPICEFVYGNMFGYNDKSNPSKQGVTVLVQDADQQIISLQDDGSPREVRISLTLIRYAPFTQRQIDPTKPTKESFYLIASEAERSYEAIARRFYGQPLLGDRLRKRHPQSPLAPQIGQKIKVPNRTTIIQEVVEPSAHMLSLTDEEAVANFERILEDRNNRKLVVTS